jgi:hypothetical protein
MLVREVTTGQDLLDGINTMTAVALPQLTADPDPLTARLHQAHDGDVPRLHRRHHRRGRSADTPGRPRQLPALPAGERELTTVKKKTVKNNRTSGPTQNPRGTRRGISRRGFLIGGAGVLGAGAVIGGGAVLRNRGTGSDGLPRAVDPGPLQLQVGDDDHPGRVTVVTAAGRELVHFDGYRLTGSVGTRGATVDDPGGGRPGSGPVRIDFEVTDPDYTAAVTYRADGWTGHRRLGVHRPRRRDGLRGPSPAARRAGLPHPRRRTRHHRTPRPRQPVGT